MHGLSRHERAKHFNMGHWGQKTDCGTSACAAGFCGLDPWFRRRGFRLEVLDGICSEFMNLEYREHLDWEAVYHFFGEDGMYPHPVFEAPTSVGGVIKAAKKRIKALKANEE